MKVVPNRFLRYQAQRMSRWFERMRSLSFEKDEKLIFNADRYPIYECWIDSDWEESRLFNVLVVRQLPLLRYTIAAFMVDTLCRGVIDTLWDADLQYDGVLYYKKDMEYEDAPLVEIPFEDARGLVLGAVAYAKGVGIEPEFPEWWKFSKYMLEPNRPFEDKFEFGRDGMPELWFHEKDGSKVIEKFRKQIDLGEIKVVMSDSPQK